MNEILFNLVQAIVIALIGVVIRYAIPYLKSKVEQSKLSLVLSYIREGVNAAEQTIEGNTEKKKKVISFMQDVLKRLNIKITDSQLDILIESVVKEIKSE